MQIKYCSEGITLKRIRGVEFTKLSSYLKASKMRGFRYFRKWYSFSAYGRHKEDLRTVPGAGSRPEQCVVVNTSILIRFNSKVSIWNASHGHHKSPGFVSHCRVISEHVNSAPFKHNEVDVCSNCCWTSSPLNGSRSIPKTAVVPTNLCSNGWEAVSVFVVCINSCIAC